MSTNATEFLTELDEKEAFLALHSCFTLNADLLLKNDTDTTPLTAKISYLANRKVFLETNSSGKLSAFTGQTSIKFFIGPEVYFIKTNLEVVDNLICFDQFVKIVQLKRRKEPRYSVPERWSQATAIWSIELKIKNNARVTDISYSGIRFEVPHLTLDFKKGDQIRIQYQIFKRAEVVCDAVVRFLMKKPNGVTVLGLEFANLQKIHRSRITSIVDDIANHHLSKSIS